MSAEVPAILPDDTNACSVESMRDFAAASTTPGTTGVALVLADTPALVHAPRKSAAASAALLERLIAGSIGAGEFQSASQCGALEAAWLGCERPSARSGHPGGV